MRVMCGHLTIPAGGAEAEAEGLFEEGFLVLVLV